MDNKKIEKIIELKKRLIAKPDTNDLLELACLWRDVGLNKKATQCFLDYLDSVKELKKTSVLSFFDGTLGKYKDEIAQFFAQGGKAGKEDEFDGESLLEMANLLYEIGSPEEAKQNYIRSFDAFIQERNEDGANKTLKILKDRYPDEKEVQKMKITISPEVDKEKLTYFVKALDEKDKIDNSGELYYIAGILFRDNGLRDDAIEQLEQGISIDSPFRVKSAMALAQLYEDMDDIISSKQILEKALNFPVTEKEKLPLYYKMANILEKEGDIEGAKKYYQIIYKMNPAYLDIREKIEVKKPEEVVKKIIPQEVEEEPEPVTAGVESIPQKERIEFL